MKEKKKDFEPPKFPDYVEISSIDNLKDPVYPTIKFMEYLFFKTKTICSKCKDYKSFKLNRHNFKGDSFSIRCKCGCIIVYPESPKRNNCRLWVEIPRGGRVE